MLPELKGKVDGISVRAPLPTGSLVDFVVTVGRDTTVDEVNQAFRDAAAGSLDGLLQYSEDPLVSTDIVHSAYSCIFDSELTMVNGPQREGVWLVRQRVGRPVPARRSDRQALLMPSAHVVQPPQDLLELFQVFPASE